MSLIKPNTIFSLFKTCNKNYLKISTILFQSNNNCIYCSKKLSTSAVRQKILTSILPSFNVQDTVLNKYLIPHFEKYGDRVAMECALSGRQYSYSELISRSNAFAANLRNEIGLVDEDTVCVITPNIIEFPVVALGTVTANCVCSPCNPLYTQDELAKQIKDTTAKCIVALDIFYTTIKQIIDQQSNSIPIILIRTSANKLPAGTFDYLTLSNPNTNTDVLNQLTKATLDQTIFRPYSSGTTGLPKGVDLTQRSFIATLQQQEILKNSLYQHLQLDNNEPLRIAGIIPFFHIMGLVATLFTKLQYGDRIIVLPQFSVPNLIHLFSNHNINVLFGAPPLILLMNANDNIKKDVLQHLIFVVNGAAALNETEVEKFKTKISSNALYMQGYGLTETPIISSFHHHLKNYTPASVGGILSNVEAKIVNVDTLEEVEDGQSGEFWVRGPQLMKGYYNNESATRESITSDGWFKTGDILYENKDGLLFVTDRIKDLIKVKGFQVAPAELENILRTHPDIADSAVVSVPHPFTGEAPRAFVVTKGGIKLNEKDVQKFIADQVIDYKQLEGGVVFIDQIPRNVAGKVLRRMLK